MESKAFVLCKVRHHVSLLPSHAIEPRVGIDQNLTEQLMHYSEPLQGVVLSFSNVQLDRPYGVIVNEMPFIHCKVLANALVFRPKAGMQLRGIVNKIGSNHIGMLFAGVFNGSVAEAELPKGYVYNYAQDCWLGKEGAAISVEDEVDVKVLRWVGCYFVHAGTAVKWADYNYVWWVLLSRIHVAGGMIAIEATMRFTSSRRGKLSSAKKLKKATHLNLAAGEPVTKSIKEIKLKNRREVDGDKTKNVKAAEKVTVTQTKVVQVVEAKVKTAKKTRNIAEFEVTKAKKVGVDEVNQTKDKKKNKKRKIVEDVVEEEEPEVMVKPKKHKEKDAKKKKHEKSKQDC